MSSDSEEDCNTSIAIVLRQIGMGEFVKAFERDGVCIEQIEIMSEEDFLKLGVEKIGHRLKIKQACRNFLKGNAHQSEVVKKFKELSAPKKKKGTASIGKRNNANNEKPTRRLYVGWKHQARPGSPYKVIAASKGGGQHVIDIDKNSSYTELVRTILDKYFPSGRSRWQSLDIEEVTYFVGNFTGEPVPTMDGSFTVAKYMALVASYPVRLYLHTQSICENTLCRDSESSSSDEQLLNPGPSRFYRTESLPSLHETETLMETTEKEGIPGDEEDVTKTNEDDHDSVFLDSGTPTVSFHPRHNRPGRLSLRQQSQQSQQQSQQSQQSETRSPYSSYVDVIDKVCIVVDSSEEEEVETPSAQQSRNLYDLLKDVADEAHGNDVLRPTIINVTRANPLDGTRRAIRRSSFNPKAKLSVRFADDFGSSEGAVDEGGPTRELMRLLLKQISELPVFSSPDSSGKTIVFNASALKDGIYKDVGVILALALLHGRFPKLFNKTSYLLLTRDDIKPAFTDIHDYEMRAVVKKLYDASTVDELQETMEANAMLFELAGCYRPVCSFSECARDKLAEDIVQFLVVTRNLPAIHQLRQGLECLRLLDLMQKNVNQFEEVLCVGEKTKLSAADVETIFLKVIYSEEGSNRKREEERIVGYWRDYIIDLQETSDGVTLEELLTFATATDQVPYLGFSPEPSIESIHGFKGERILAQANTCAMVLRLPVVDSYDVFKTEMDFSILNSPGFGQA